MTQSETPNAGLKNARLAPDQVLPRFLQHVLPRGLQRVRSFGWLAPAAKARWERIQALLDCHPPALRLPDPIGPPLCPCCHKPMLLLGALPRAPP